MQKFWLPLTLAALALGALTLPGCNAAQAQSLPDTQNERRIHVTGTATIYAKPDIATISLGASHTALKLADAKKAADEAMQKVHASLRSSGIKAEDIQTINYQIYQIPAQTNPSRPAQWKVFNQVQVKVRAVDTVASVIDKAVNSGANSVSQIDYGIEAIAALRAKARENAVRAAKDKAEHLAKLNGVSLGAVISIVDGNMDTGLYQNQMSNSMARMDYEGGGGGGGVFSGGQIAIQAYEQIAYEIR